MTSGNQVTAGGFVPGAGEGQAFWSPDSVTVPKAGRDPRATPEPSCACPGVQRRYTMTRPSKPEPFRDS